MSSNQKRTLILLIVIGIVYFAAFFAPNAKGARDENMLKVFSGDETITYPYVVHMLTTPKDFSEFKWRMIIYGDYHYGYPFYFFSMLSVLPVKLIYGSDFTSHMQLNLLLLRQFISVLPMILAAGVLVFANTRFEKPVRSAALFVFILAIPGLVRNNMWWWHPDALSVLAVSLTLLFLTLDKLRLGRYFFLAAAACGFSIAVKLVGFFFVFALAGYVLAAIITRQISFQQAAIRSIGFIALMSFVVAISNPFLIYESQREKLVAIQTQKSDELYNGYKHDDPTYYQKGLRWWMPTLERWYGPPAFLALVLALGLAGCAWGSNRFISRLVMAWFIPYAIYLIFFVAVKPDHYWLPIILPLFSVVLNPLSFNRAGKYGTLGFSLSLMAAGVLLWQLGQFVGMDISLYQEVMHMEELHGY